MEPRDFDQVQPTELTWRDDGGIAITFSDGHRGVFLRPWLRAMCPCATCAGTHGPPTTLVDARAGGKTPAAAENTVAAPAKSKPKFAISAGPRPPRIDTSLRLDRADPVGAYGMKLRWGDGHDTGIFTWRYLRAASPGDGTPEHPPTAAALLAMPRTDAVVARAASER